jgi:hypothetical protein
MENIFHNCIHCNYKTKKYNLLQHQNAIHKLTNEENRK